MKAKGRHWLVLWLLVFLVVTAIVVARDATSYRTALRVAALREARLALEAEQAELRRRIRVGQSRRELVPKVERNLGLRRPSDREYQLFPMPPAPEP